MNIKGINHIGLNVRDMDAAIAFYCGKLGFKDAFILNAPDGRPVIRYIMISPGQYLELFYRSPEEGPDNPAYSHLCLEVEDVHAIAEELRSLGLLTREVNCGKAGNLQCWSADPEGNRIEFVQVMPDSMHRKFESDL